MLAAALSGQLRGPDVELAGGIVAASDDWRGIGPAATLSINHGYLLFTPLYVRVGLGVSYRNFVVNDTEWVDADGEPAVRARRFELQQVYGRGTGVLGVEVGKWSLELGAAYQRPLWLDNQFTTATFNDRGVVVMPTSTIKLPFNLYTPPDYRGEYYRILHADWSGTVAVNARLNHRLAIGLRYHYNLGRAVVEHSNVYTRTPGFGQPTVEIFRRAIPVSLDMVLLSLRYRLSNE